MSSVPMTATTYPGGGSEIDVELHTIPDFVREDLAAATLASVEDFLRQPGGREFIEARKLAKRPLQRQPNERGSSMEERIRIAVIEPNKPAYVTEIANSLASMQSVVGGYIEVVPADCIPGGQALRGQNLLLVLNEEGKYQGLEPNFPIRDGADWIVGTAFLCKSRSDEMTSVSEEDAELVNSLLGRKEALDD